MLYKNYNNELYILCLKYCKNKADAQDNLQDAFLKIYSKIKSFNGKGSFIGWMKRITINTAIDRYKNDKTISIEINNDLIVERDFNSSILKTIPLNQILECIQNLPTQYRLVFSLYELDSYSHKEISEMLSISINTSKSNLHRAKQILQNRIEELGYKHSKSTVNGN